MYMTHPEDLNFSDTLKGKTLAKINKSDDEIVFLAETGETYKLFHAQDCCESVYVEDICGNLEDLIGEELLAVEEVISEENSCVTGTFYKLQTKKGAVTIRWVGESNGYYSESVSFRQVTQ